MRFQGGFQFGRCFSPHFTWPDWHGAFMPNSLVGLRACQSCRQYVLSSLLFCWATSMQWNETQFLTPCSRVSFNRWGLADVIFPSPPPHSHRQNWSLGKVGRTSLWKCLEQNVGDHQPFRSKILSDTFAWSLISNMACVLSCIGWIRARSTALSKLVALRGTLS